MEHDSKIKFKNREMLLDDFVLRKLIKLDRAKLSCLAKELEWPLETVRGYIKNLIKKGYVRRDSINYKLTYSGAKRAQKINWLETTTGKKDKILIDNTLNIMGLIPNKPFTDGEVYVEETNSFLRVWYKPKNRGHAPNPSIIPKYIKLDDFFLSNIGLISGDGRISLSEISSFTFTNTEPKLINSILRFLYRYFSIKKDQIHWTVTLNKSIKNNSELIKKTIDLWEKECRLDQSFMTNIIWDERVNDGGAVQINYYNASFRMVFQAIFEYLKKQSELSQTYSIPYLRGLFAAEGSTILKKGGTIDRLSVASKNNAQSTHISKILKNIGIKHKITPIEIQIYGFENFAKLWRCSIIGLHPEKAEKFYNALLHFKNYFPIIQDKIEYGLI